jgi:epsilon-lactone hydrolase
MSVTREDVAGWPVYHAARSANPDVGNYVVFLHGGGFINEIVRAHWRFIGYLTRNARVRCVVPIYPLAPRATAKEVVPAMGNLLRKILEEAGPARVTVVGNSAGAGLGLAAAQWLRDSGYRQPSGLVMISPGGDFSISRPEQIAIAARDPINDIPGAREAGRLYAGDLDVTIAPGALCSSSDSNSFQKNESKQAQRHRRHPNNSLSKSIQPRRADQR